jgi:hypothetical protein
MKAGLGLKGLASTLAAGCFVAMVTVGTAQADPIFPGWTCYGNCGTLGADGVVTLSPFGAPKYSWVSTEGGDSDEGQLPGEGGTNGSRLVSPLFAAASGDILSFYFNFVTSDGAGFADYGWATLMNSPTTIDAILFTARTQPTGDIVPGFDLPGLAPGVVLTPGTSGIIGGGPAWSPLGGSSGGMLLGRLRLHRLDSHELHHPDRRQLSPRHGCHELGRYRLRHRHGHGRRGDQRPADRRSGAGGLALFGLGLLGLAATRRRTAA